MKMKTLIVILFPLLTGVAYAGVKWWLTCENQQCKFEGQLRIGGGTISEEVSGYCTKCNQFVHLSWRRPNLSKESEKLAVKAHLPEQPPIKIGNILSLEAGTTNALYSCPKCGSPFAEITMSTISEAKRRESGLLVCPHCTNETMRLRGPGFYD